ncbi:TolC family protein [Escherichia coli]|nr:TolC family protein [Escherichia coli]
MLFSPVVLSTPLNVMLSDALRNDPGIREAYADFESARNRIEQSRSAHWPKVVAIGTQPISQKNQYDTESNHFDPGLNAEMNLYSFGAIELDVEKNKHNAGFYRYKLAEKYEETAYEIISLYFDALKEKKAIEVLNRSLMRHQSILNDLDSIAFHDKGRESEYVQAKARKLLVEQQINSRYLALDSALSKISSYTKKQVKESDLDNVFNSNSAKSLIQKYKSNIRTENPSYLAQQENLESKRMELEAEKRINLPRLDLNGTVTRDNKEISLNIKWDLFNRSTGYNIKEKISQVESATSRVESVIRDIDETRRISEIIINQTIKEISILLSQIKESENVVDFYKLQFQVARKTLIEVLNSQSELSNVELQYVESQNRLNHGLLDYLRSQGAVTQWCCSNITQQLKNEGVYLP